MASSSFTSSSKLFFLLSPILLPFLASQATAQLEQLYHECYNKGSYAPNSPFERNLKNLLNSLATKTHINYGFYNFSSGKPPNKAYAIGICRPDMDFKSCRSCISAISKNVTSICPYSSLAIAGFDDRGFNYCMLRYANYNIFSLMENAPYFFVHSLNDIRDVSPEKFNQTRKRLLTRLISKAAARPSPKKYAVGDEVVEKILRIYALVQCNPDLSEADCTRCLNDTLVLIPECCDAKEGGRVITPACSFRYELSKFYKPSIERKLMELQA